MTVTVTVAVGEGEGLGDAEGLAEGEGEGVADGLGVGLGDGEGEGEGLGDGEGCAAAKSAHAATPVSSALLEGVLRCASAKPPSGFCSCGRQEAEALASVFSPISLNNIAEMDAAYARLPKQPCNAVFRNWTPDEKRTSPAETPAPFRASSTAAVLLSASGDREFSELFFSFAVRLKLPSAFWSDSR